MNPILIAKSFSACSGRIRRLRPVLIALSFTSLALGLSACATARGFGQDVGKAGEKIEEAATR